MKEKIRNTQKGITLVALVITIIVMLLLSVVSINIMQNAGIIEKVKLTKEEHRESTIQEQKELFEKEIEISKYEGTTPKTINDLLNKLEEEKLITEEEKNTIMQTGRITIGSKEIIFSEDAILPDGYARCEYLESTGTQYIDTGIFANNDSIAEIEYFYKQGQIGNMFGSFINNNAQNNRFAAYASTNTIYMYFGSYGINKHTIVGIKFSEENNLKFSKDGIFLNGNLIKEHVDNAETFTTVKPMLLFATNGNGAYCGKHRMGNVKFYSDGNRISFNGIPCLDSDNKSCMYDTVSGQTFYNQGTGEFIAGPIVE